MKIRLAVLSLLLAGSGYAQGNSQNAPFLGRWDVTLHTPAHAYSSWLELTEEQGQLKARMVSRWGNARPLPKVTIQNGELTFVSPKEEEDSKKDLVFHAKLVAGKLVGTETAPDGSLWHWTGEKAPSLARKAPEWGAPVPLFDGKSLAGWHEYGLNPFPVSGHHWAVKDGLLVSPGHGLELATDRRFQDFKLHLEFNIGPQANSGVYLRGRYELQIENESEEEPPSHHTGGIYGYLAPKPELPRTTGKWQTYDITLVGRHVTVVQNGTTVVDDQEIPGITGGAIDSHEGLPGPLILQGSEKGQVSFRNVTIAVAK